MEVSGQRRTEGVDAGAGRPGSPCPGQVVAVGWRPCGAKPAGMVPRSLDMADPVRERRRRAGLPAATELAGMFLVTPAPAPMMVCGPTVTPSRIVTLEPIQTSSPIVMPTAV